MKITITITTIIITIIVPIKCFLQLSYVVKKGKLAKYQNNIHSPFFTAYNETFVYNLVKTEMSMRDWGSTSKGL